MEMVSEAALLVKASQEKKQEPPPPESLTGNSGDLNKQFSYNEMKLVHITLPMIFHPRNMSTQNVRFVLGLSS